MKKKSYFLILLLAFSFFSLQDALEKKNEP